jgi:hypothetical protein
VEAKHLDVKSGALSTNGKEDWLVQLLQREKRQDDAGIFGASLRVTGRDTLLRPSVSTYVLLRHFQECTRALGTPARDNSRSRHNAVLLLDALADNSSPWLTGNPGGDLRHLPYALAKFVQDQMYNTVAWIPTPSTHHVDRLDPQMFSKLLKPAVTTRSRKKSKNHEKNVNRKKSRCWEHLGDAGNTLTSYRRNFCGLVVQSYQRTGANNALEPCRA